MRMARIAAAAALAIALVAGSSLAQPAPPPTFRIEGPRDEPSAELLRATLARPHIVLFGDPASPVHLARGDRQERSVVVVGGPATVQSEVRGDVIVVGGDLFVHPGARISGRAVAIGGGVYPSSLAYIALGTRSFRDHTYDATREGEVVVLRYRRTRIDRPTGWEFPIIAGIRVPQYTRVDGLSLPWGPVFRPTQRLELDATVTYRSHIGAIDPGLRAELELPNERTVEATVARITASNDRWIRSDPINSLTTLGTGQDLRNYHRADRGELLVGRTFTVRTLVYTLKLGGAVERAWSAGSPDSLGSRPWSFGGREDTEQMARPNPPVARGRTSSALLDGSLELQLQDVLIRGTGRLEQAFDAPRTGAFTQATLDFGVRFPTFGSQRFRTEVHTVLTAGDAPPQRWAYLGGSGTLPTVEVPLGFGGDRLFLLDNRYEIPIEAIRVRFLGSPTLTFRHLAGSAGVGRLPGFIHNLGTRLSISLLKVEAYVDPESRDTKVSAGVSFTR